MKPSNRRKKPHTYIAELDDKNLSAMLTLLKAVPVYPVTFAYSSKEKAAIREREQNRLSGKSKTYSLAEAKKKFRLPFCRPPFSIS